MVKSGIIKYWRNVRDEEIHHRGNLCAYLRLLGIEPPQMVHNYGELFMEDEDGL